MDWEIVLRLKATARTRPEPFLCFVGFKCVADDRASLDSVRTLVTSDFAPLDTPSMAGIWTPLEALSQRCEYDSKV